MIDLNDGKLLTFNDVFQAKTKSQLKSFLKSKFISIYGKESLLDQFEISENFEIDKNPDASKYRLYASIISYFISFFL